MLREGLDAVLDRHPAAIWLAVIVLAHATAAFALDVAIVTAGAFKRTARALRADRPPTTGPTD